MKWTLKASLISPLVLIALITFNGCASLMIHAQKEQVHEYVVRNTGYDSAYTKALKAVTNMGFQVQQADKASGTFSAGRGTGFSEISIFNFMIEKNNSRSIATIRIKSNHPDEIRSEFLKAYGKYVKVEEAQ